MSVAKLPVKMLSDLISPRALERIIQDAALSRDTTPDDLKTGQMEDILKKEVFKRLQLSVPAPLAKKRVTEVLKELDNVPQTPTIVRGISPIPRIEESAKKFTLYFDWPEAQRLRGVIGIARTEEEAGREIGPLVQEAHDLLGQMERRLQEGLVAQAQDLAELKATFTRVQGLGGKDVRRLENLITQIDEAQAQTTLLPAEVERARNITFKLRKRLESSVVQKLDPAQPTAQATAVPADAQARVQALEQEHVARQLTDLSREFAPLLLARPDLETQQEEFRVRLSTGALSSDTLDIWRGSLEQARQAALEHQRNELTSLETQLSSLPDGPAAHDFRVTLDVARLTLSGGGLATDELRELRSVVSALSYSPTIATRILEQQRELADLERSAREVSGASAELTPLLIATRESVSRGENVDFGPLWAILERYMGQAALQREDFDARADHVVNEYDQVRSLAGETTQRLGRLADTLRAQRRLGPMSAQARERYAQTLTDAEALLSEARAEFQAAQQVTSTFGEDALSDLLDVFDLGGNDTNTHSTNTHSTSAHSTASNTLYTTPEARAASAFDALAGLTADHSFQSDTTTTDTRTVHKTAETWTLENGQLVRGNPDSAVLALAAMLSQAAELGMQRLDMGDAGQVWSARSTGQNAWRLARAANWDALDAGAGRWLDSGED